MLLLASTSNEETGRQYEAKASELLETNCFSSTILILCKIINKSSLLFKNRSSVYCIVKSMLSTILLGTSGYSQSVLLLIVDEIFICLKFVRCRVDLFQDLR